MAQDAHTQELPITLRGEVLRVDEYDGKHGRYPIVTVDIGQYDVEPVSFHAFANQAKERIRELDPQPGQEIAVVYKGQRTLTSGNKPHVFAIGTR